MNPFGTVRFRAEPICERCEWTPEWEFTWSAGPAPYCVFKFGMPCGPEDNECMFISTQRFQNRDCTVSVAGILCFFLLLCLYI